MNKRYTIGEVCELLKVKQYYLRNLEKVLDLTIQRDNFNNRSYTQEDVNLLKQVKELKDKGLTNQAIKKCIENELATTDENLYLDNKVTSINKIFDQVPDQTMETLKILIDDLIISNIDDLLDEKKESLLHELIEIKESQNEILKNSNNIKSELERTQELHYKEIDIKLMELKEQLQLRKNQKSSFFKKLFNKKKVL